MSSVRAADYPSKTSRVIVPLGAGGSMDPLGRAVAAGLAEGLGQPVYVDNRPGAAGQIGADAVAKTPGDPYNLFLGSMGIMSISPTLYPNLPYDVKRDFTPLGLCALVPYALIINPNVIPVRTMQEFLQWAKKQTAPIAYGTVGSGSLAHVGGVMLSTAAGLKMQQVPYRSVTQMTTDMIKGDLPLTFNSPTGYTDFAKEGKLRILGVTSPKRIAFLPDVPTLAEGGLPGFDLVNWYGLYAPRDVDPKIVDILQGHLAKILRSDKLREQVAVLGLEIPTENPRDFAAFCDRDRARWNDFLTKNHITLEKA